ncbi:hypothetical protein [Bacillus sp. 3255]|uniref:hypothetical protein n=1 Tax=Bacillus sp. 3255 TaxID=2817904 RepID=UPI00285AC7F8|nr:hypothetical protein [Bacillus sp. 3255]MDR6880725.1 hypothetical protein [Bacillus sp. 3255]
MPAASDAAREGGESVPAGARAGGARRRESVPVDARAGGAGRALRANGHHGRYSRANRRDAILTDTGALICRFRGKFMPDDAK